MKTKLSLLFFLFFCMVFMTACFKNEKVELADLDWFLGNWEVDNNQQFETWERVDDQLYRGKSYKLRNNDTILLEKIDLIKNEKGIFYIPKVLGQNEGKPIEFRMVIKEGSHVVFENKAHDFPQRIEYHLEREGVIQAWIKGIEEKKRFRKIGFLLQKID